MSNNIYDILKKIENLEDSKQTTLTESAKVCKICGMKNCKCEDKKHESKKKDKADKGAIAEAVKTVESQLNEKYMGFKKTVAAIKKGGSADDPEAVAAAIGRKKYGKEKFQKAAAAGKKLGEDYKSDMKAKDIESRDKEFQADMDFVKSGGGYTDTSGTTYDRHGNPLADAGKTRAKDSATRTYPVYRTPGVGTGSPDRQMKEGEYNEDMLSPAQKKFAALAEPKDKITYADKIAGAKKKQKDEGNEFSGELVKARAQGKDSFKVDGKSYPVKEDDADFLGGFDDRGNARLSPAGARKVEKHPNYDPNRSANAQYSDHFDQRGYQRMTHDQAVEVGKHPEYNPNLPANAQHHLLSKSGPESGNMQAMKEGRTSMREGWEEMQKYLEKKRGPESKGGAGKKAGTRYGGSAQKDDDEELDGEGQPAVKKKGRPKGTGGGAKFSFKKPKD